MQDTQVTAGLKTNLTPLMISGSIFRATHLHNGQVVALKVQYIHHECPTNAYERHVYPLIQGGVGMPRLYAAGIQEDWDFLAIDLLGPSLDNLYRRSGKDTMDMRSVCAIAIQVVRSVFFSSRQLLVNTLRSCVYNSCIIGKFCIEISNLGTV